MINLGSNVWDTLNRYKKYLKGESKEKQFPKKENKLATTESASSPEEIYYQGSIFNVWD